MTHDFDDCPAKPRIEALEAREMLQNGTVQRLEGKLDRMQDKMDRLLWTILGGLGAVVMALIAAVITGALV
ncbi:MAG: hypothetical protein ABFE07_02795 [Armatimonadia bacterium]